MMMKERGISFDKNGYKIKATEIPDDIEVKAKLDVILPQEKLQMVNIGLNMQKLGMPDEYIQSNLLGITNTKEIKSQFVQQQAETSLLQYKLQQKVQQIQQQDQQREQQKQAQLQQAIQAVQQQGHPLPSQEPAGPQLTQGQMLEADMIQNGVNAMDTGQFAENMPPMGPEGMPMEGMMPENGMPGVMPGMEMEGGLPPQMGGMIPGEGLAGMPDEMGMMR